jgi:hypothetical protein
MAQRMVNARTGHVRQPDLPEVGNLQLGKSGPWITSECATIQELRDLGPHNRVIVTKFRIK